MKHYIFNQDLTQSFYNEDHDLNNEIERLEKKYYNQSTLILRNELLKEISEAKKNNDQDLLDFLKDELDDLWY